MKTILLGFILYCLLTFILGFKTKLNFTVSGQLNILHQKTINKGEVTKSTFPPDTSTKSTDSEPFPLLYILIAVTIFLSIVCIVICIFVIKLKRMLIRLRPLPTIPMEELDPASISLESRDGASLGGENREAYENSPNNQQNSFDYDSPDDMRI